MQQEMTPEQYRQQQIASVEEQKLLLEKQLADARANYEKQIQRLSEEIKLRKRKGNYAKYKEKLLKKEERIDQRYDEERIRYKNELNAVNEGLTKLKSGQNLSSEQIKKYAKDVGRFYEAKEEDKYRRREPEREVKRLTKLGYEPLVVEREFKGKPVETTLTFYDPKTKDFRVIEKFKEKPQVDIKGYEKLGYTEPVKRDIQIGGQKFEFDSRVGVFKSPEGEYVTPYERTGIYEQDIRKQQEKELQEQQLKEFRERQEEIKKGSITLPFKVIPASDLPSGYGRGTIQTTPSDILFLEEPEQQKKKSPVVDFLKSAVAKPFEYYTGGREKIVSVSDKYFTYGDTAKITSLNLIKDIEAGQTKVLETYKGKENIYALDKELEDKYSKVSQQTFESKYGERIITKQVTQEEAEKEYFQSPEFKSIESRYGEEYTKRYGELQARKGGLFKYGFGTLTGLKLATQELQKFSLKFVSSPAETVLTTGEIMAYEKALGSLPKLAGVGLGVGFGAYGTYKFLSPTSTPLERGLGLVTASVSFGVLGYSLRRYLKQQVLLPREAIKLPQASVMTEKGTAFFTTKNGVVEYPKQKIGQQVRAGSMQPVTSQYGVLKKSFFKAIGFDIPRKDWVWYEGIPKAQPKQYQQTLKNLMKYNRLTESQARARLRYHPARFSDIMMEGKLVQISKDVVSGEFKVSLEPKVVDIDKTRGIKTRGGRVITRGKDIVRIPVNEYYKDSQFFLEFERPFVSAKTPKIRILGSADVKIMGDIKTAVRLGKSTPRTYLDSFTYKEASIESGVVRPVSIGDFKPIGDGGVKTYRLVGTKRTPFEQESAKELVKEMITKDTIKKVLQTTKRPDVARRVFDSSQQSIYAGTGQYERTEVLSRLSVQPDISVPRMPTQVKIPTMKQLTGFELAGIQKNLLLSSLKPKLKTGLKTFPKLKDILKDIVQQKELVKTVQKIDTVQRQPLKLSTGQFTTQVPSFDFVPPRIIIPRPVLPRPEPIIREPTIPTPIFWLPEEDLTGKKGKRGVKNIYDVAYLPDFTARALGLEPEKITQKQAEQRLKKLYTGLEIRRSVRLV